MTNADLNRIASRGKEEHNPMTVWRLIAHWNDPENIVAWTREKERITIGWGCSGDLRQFPTPEAVGEGILRGWPESYNWMYGKKQLWDFCHTMKIDDLVILSTGKYRALVAQIKGDYEWAASDERPPKNEGEGHQRRVQISSLDPDVIWRLSGGAAPGYSIRWTLARCNNEVTAEDL